ncbi:hypothetical protein MHYP_G00048920 [Metynnis hypsauchen]
MLRSVPWASPCSANAPERRLPAAGLELAECLRSVCVFRLENCRLGTLRLSVTEQKNCGCCLPINTCVTDCLIRALLLSCEATAFIRLPLRRSFGFTLSNRSIKKAEISAPPPYPITHNASLLRVFSPLGQKHGVNRRRAEQGFLWFSFLIRAAAADVVQFRRSSLRASLSVRSVEQPSSSQSSSTAVLLQLTRHKLQQQHKSAT